MLFNNVIYHIISHVKRELYENVQYNISNKNFRKSETIFFTEKDLVKAKWKEEKEFILNGYSYDVIRISIIKGKKYFLCYIDKKDIIINSLLTFSEKLRVKKVNVRKQIDLPVHERSISKRSNFFTAFEGPDLNVFNIFYIRILPNHYTQLENTHYSFIIIPPPEGSIHRERI
ncbi:MAG: hypothetical protein P0Y62_10655 [Candidatus Chryseobacterium colombiense]|nr:hypothetical protein [Chryseobacterium sp.]WEK68327.1 MAG: hypothetical protein P0Y62_10655 [Chryseobacterium sp.]